MFGVCGALISDINGASAGAVMGTPTYCQLGRVLRTVKARGQNQGRHFLNCPSASSALGSNCPHNKKAFKWATAEEVTRALARAASIV
jgi:hypothetical protein